MLRDRVPAAHGLRRLRPRPLRARLSRPCRRPRLRTAGRRAHGHAPGGAASPRRASAAGLRAAATGRSAGDGSACSRPASGHAHRAGADAVRPRSASTGAAGTERARTPASWPVPFGGSGRLGSARAHRCSTADGLRRASAARVPVHGHRLPASRQGASAIVRRAADDPRREATWPTTRRAVPSRLSRPPRRCAGLWRGGGSRSRRAPAATASSP